MAEQDFETSRRVFQDIKKGGPLDENALLRQLNRGQVLSSDELDEIGQLDPEIAEAVIELNRQIEAEDRRQAADDLSVANNPNVHPEIAAKHARLAGTAIKSGEDLKLTKSGLKRLGKALNDPNVPEESIAREMTDIEDQVMIRSVNRGGQRGVSVTGGRSPGEFSDVFSLPIEYGNILNAPGGGSVPAQEGRFFSEPEETTQRALDRVLQTLEPEFSVLSGKAGQEDIAGQRARNKAKLAQFSADQPKQVTIKPGEQIIEVSPGKAEPLITAPPKAIKSPTTIEAALLRPGITDKEKADLINLKKSLKGKGLSGSITLPDGTTIAVGESALGEPSKPFITQIQKETLTAASGLQELTTLQKKITPESFGATASLKKALQETFEFLSPGSTPKWAAETTKNRDKLFRQSGESFALWVKKLTGVQFGEKEATRLKKGYPNSDDNFAEYNNKFEDIIDSYVRSMARLVRFGMPLDDRLKKVDSKTLRKVINSVPLGVITQAEIDNVKQMFSITEEFPTGQPAAAGSPTAPQAATGAAPIPQEAAAGGKLTPELAAQIFKMVGGDKELARKIAQDMGLTP